MANIQQRFDRLLACCRDLYEATPDLRDFASWPGELQFAVSEAVIVPAIDLVKGWKNHHPVHLALQDVADIAAWQRSYTENQVGQQFLKSYGFIELFGPTGHYLTADVRAFIGYWGAGLAYDWHQHEAEEIYSVVSGGALFRSQGEADRYLGPGETRQHKSNQPHAITMTDEPLLAFAMWRGPGMADPTSQANRFSDRSAVSQPEIG